MKPPTLFSDLTTVNDSKEIKKRSREKRARKRMEAKNKRNMERLNLNAISEEEKSDLVVAKDNLNVDNESMVDDLPNIGSSSPAPDLREYQGNIQVAETTQTQFVPMLDPMTQLYSVRAIGDGPNYNKVEGYLCQWITGNVTIVCHCHGSYFTAAEFVAHAGYTGLINPIRHITVFTEPGL